MAKKVDPSSMGLIKAPVAVIYMAAGQSIEDAQKHAGNVDAVAGIGVMFLLPRLTRSVPQIVIDHPGSVVDTNGAGQQAQFFTKNVPGMTLEQASPLLNKSFARGSNVVVGGSRVRGNYRPASDLDVGFDNLTTSQSGKIKSPGTKLGPLTLEPPHIVPGNETPNTPEIQSAGEFFQRSGVRGPRDARAGHPLLHRGQLLVKRMAKSIFAVQRLTVYETLAQLLFDGCIKMMHRSTTPGILINSSIC